MPYYANLSPSGIVSAVTETSAALTPSAALVEIDGLRADLLGKLYNPASGQFVDAPADPAAEPEWAWLLDIAPFTDRLGAAAVAIDVSTEPPLVAIRSDFARRKWIDLKDPRVAAAIAYLSGQPHPVLGTLAQPLLTPAQAQAILTTKPAPAENLALRKLYFSA